MMFVFIIMVMVNMLLHINLSMSMLLPTGRYFRMDMNIQFGSFCKPRSVKIASPKQKFQRCIALYRLHDSSLRHLIPNPPPDRLSLCIVHQIYFIEQNNIGALNLIDCQNLIMPTQFGNLFGVYDSNDAIDLDRRSQEIKCTGNEGRVGNTTWLNDDIFRRIWLLNNLFGGLQEVVTDGAANAAVRHADGFALNIRYQLSIDVDCTKIIDQHCNAQAVFGVQNAVEQCCLAYS